jgi:hypothetical protein
MPVKIYCQCGTDVTDTVSEWDRKTRTVFWMHEHSPVCAACSQRRVLVPDKQAWAPKTKTAEYKKKTVAGGSS